MYNYVLPCILQLTLDLDSYQDMDSHLRAQCQQSAIRTSSHMSVILDSSQMLITPPQAGVPTQQGYTNPAMTTTHTQQQQSNVTIVHVPPAVQQAPPTPQPASATTPISESVSEQLDTIQTQLSLYTCNMIYENAPTSNIVSGDNNFCYSVF